MEYIKTGVIGLGRMGRHHLPGICQLERIAACWHLRYQLKNGERSFGNV